MLANHHTGSISHHIMPLFLEADTDRQTHTQVHTDTDTHTHTHTHTHQHILQTKEIVTTYTGI